MKHFIRYWLPLILYLCLIFYLSSLPQPTNSGLIVTFSYQDKLFHIIEYSILSILIFRTNLNKGRSFILSSVFGILDEIHQSFVPSRYFSLLDIAANIIGSLVVFLVNKKMHTSSRHKI
ncbi:hypothetical protein D6777_01590 [Candidatus Woesearchaeota archaeon]|nr:MAG: hypothetical protein D6777_01590 [Candidatus Woesearchaeota archaeon]